MEEDFEKNRIRCSLAAANVSVTLGFVVAGKAKPMTLLKGNELNSSKAKKIEKLGVEFEERDGLFYPLLDDAVSGNSVKTKDIGKYGQLWINFMQEAYPERYRSLVRFGLLEEKAVAVNEEAYELTSCMEEKQLNNSDAESTFAEKYVLRMQVRILVEEIVMREVINVFH